MYLSALSISLATWIPIHLTAVIFGETGVLLSMTALGAAAEGGRKAIID